MTETEPSLEEKIQNHFLVPYTLADEQRLADLIDVLEGRATIYQNGGIIVEEFEDFTDVQKVIGYAVLCYYATRVGGRDAPEFDAKELGRQAEVSRDAFETPAVKRIGNQYRLDLDKVEVACDILKEDYAEFPSSGSDERHGTT